MDKLGPSTGLGCKIYSKMRRVFKTLAMFEKKKWGITSMNLSEKWSCNLTLANQKLILNIVSGFYLPNNIKNKVPGIVVIPFMHRCKDHLPFCFFHLVTVLPLHSLPMLILIARGHSSQLYAPWTKGAGSPAAEHHSWPITLTTTITSSPPGGCILQPSHWLLLQLSLFLNQAQLPPPVDICLSCYFALIRSTFFSKQTCPNSMAKRSGRGELFLLGQDGQHQVACCLLFGLWPELVWPWTDTATCNPRKKVQYWNIHRSDQLRGLETSPNRHAWYWPLTCIVMWKKQMRESKQRDIECVIFRCLLRTDLEVTICRSAHKGGLAGIPSTELLEQAQLQQLHCPSVRNTLVEVCSLTNSSHACRTYSYLHICIYMGSAQAVLHYWECLIDFLHLLLLRQSGFMLEAVGGTVLATRLALEKARYASTGTVVYNKSY